MKSFPIGITLLLACSACSTSADNLTDGSVVDATVGVDASVDSVVVDFPAIDFPPVGLRRLVTAETGLVGDFTVHADTLYAIVQPQVAGQSQKLIRCPLEGCPVNPQLIDQMAGGRVTRYAGVIGSTIMWTHSDNELYRADLAGGGVKKRYGIIVGEIYGPFASDGQNLLVGFDDSVNSKNGILRVAPDESAPAQVAPFSGRRYAPNLFTTGGGRIAFWQRAEDASPIAIQLTGQIDGGVAEGGKASDIPPHGLLIVGDRLFWVENQIQFYDLFACSLSDPSSCMAPVKVATKVGPAIATDQDRVYFTQTITTGEDLGQTTTGNIFSCNLDEALQMMPCATRRHATGNEWIGLRQLYATPAYLYGLAADGALYRYENSVN